MENSEIDYSGFLYHKTSYLHKKKGVKSFIKLCRGSIYIYPNSNVDKPKMVVVLAAFSEIEIVTGRKKFPLYVILIRPTTKTNSISPLVFGTTTEPEMEFVVHLFKTSIGKSQQILFNNNEPSYIKENKKNTLSSSSFVSWISDANEFQRESQVSEYDSCVSSDESSNYDKTEETFIKNLESCNFEELYFNPKDESFHDKNRDDENVINDSSIYAEDYPVQLEYVIFKGTSPEAFQELQKNTCFGAYLVRQDNGRQILTVQCSDAVLKFILTTDQNSNHIKIQDQEIMFNSLQELLSYYHKNDIPGRQCKLVIPYKLRK